MSKLVFNIREIALQRLLIGEQMRSWDVESKVGLYPSPLRACFEIFSAG
jgi:hypothetical protein